jgi:hypothetical protein
VPKVEKDNGEGSSDSESRTPHSKRKKTNISRTKGGSSKITKDIGNVFVSSLGATQILEVITQHLPFDTLARIEHVQFVTNHEG